MPKVSVVIPYFNRSQTIRRCVESIANQTFIDFECIVIDDGSEISEAQALTRILKEQDDERFILSAICENRGGAAARNKGIDLAQGEYIAFLDSDDEWLPEKLEKQLECASENDVPFVSCQSVVHYAHGKGILPMTILSDERISEYLFCNKGWLQTSSFLIQRKALGSTRFDESLPRHQDYDLLFQLEEKGIRPAMVQLPLVAVHWDDLGISGRARNIDNSIRFVKSRAKSFSTQSKSCFVAKFILIPEIKNKGRRAVVRTFSRAGVGFIRNRNLAVEVLSTLIFKDPRLLVWFGKLKTRLT
jgi:glycosyltransferase involved in cell wall biosynthesis